MVLSPSASAEFIVKHAKFLKIKEDGIDKLSHEVIKKTQLYITSNFTHIYYRFYLEFKTKLLMLKTFHNMIFIQILVIQQEQLIGFL